jgi:BirA family transcriptional regulator, biotin operon repressor / biotin---[acetyl-CoA-carboxylase] ligase
MSEPLPAELQAALDVSAPRRGRFGEPAVFYTETGSTNDVASGLAERGAPEGAMVVALAQSAGRGRLGRSWFSPAGAGLYVSLVCRTARAAPLLTLAGGVAVAAGIREATGLPAGLKWPNDVVISDAAQPGRRRKLAGILAEGCTGPAGLQHVVLGIGINVQRAAYPPSLVGRATSIETELGRPVEPWPILAAVLVSLNEQVTALEAGCADRLLERWRALAPSAAGCPIEWSVNGSTRRGTTAGIDERGALLVRVGDRIERIVAGELTWLG